MDPHEPPSGPLWAKLDNHLTGQFVTVQLDGPCLITWSLPTRGAIKSQLIEPSTSPPEEETLLHEITQPSQARPQPFISSLGHMSDICDKDPQLNRGLSKMQGAGLSMFTGAQSSVSHEQTISL